MQVKNILFDFDGVILDSMHVRELGFKSIFAHFDSGLVELLLHYHNANGGLSRYEKIKYFYNEILNKDISEDRIKEYADEFSLIMRESLTDRKYLIFDTLNFIANNFQNYNFHIVSGSDELELKFLCRELGIDRYFDSIHGSPTHKNILVESLMLNNKYTKCDTILIGDSINDYEAARVNGIMFYGFNNQDLIGVCDNYLESFLDCC